MDSKLKWPDTYRKPEVEVLVIQTCDVLASSDGRPKNGGIEDVEFEDWN